MANDALAPVEPPGTPSEDEYQTFCAALSASARGRAFLAEYARRHRGADTEMLLAALAKLDALVRVQARAGADQLRSELRRLLGTIRAARPELEQSALPARAAKLAVLLDLLERRIEAMAEAAPAPIPAGETARLLVVPPPDEPQLPIPTPAAAQPLALALAHERAPPPLPAGALEKAASKASATIIPEVAWFDGTPAAAAEIGNALPPAPPAVEPLRPPAIAATAEASAPPPAEAAMSAPPASETKIAEPPAEENLWAQSTGKIAPPPPDPLAALMALSEEERIALFT